MATDQTPSDLEICFMATEADETLAAIRTRLEASMKEAGAGYFGKKSAAEFMWKLGQALAGRHPQRTRHLRRNQ